MAAAILFEEIYRYFWKQRCYRMVIVLLNAQSYLLKMQILNFKKCKMGLRQGVLGPTGAHGYFAKN